MAWHRGASGLEVDRSHRSSELCARGQRVGNAMVKTNLTLDDETFEEIANRARARSFCSEAREIIEIGLETLKAEGW